MESWIALIIVVITFCCMEIVAWATHKYIMHGWLWYFHEDHHNHDSRLKPFERNDFFFLLFATPGILLINKGYNQLSLAFWIGLGITIYGFAYFLVHDLFIHQRIKIFRKINHPYFEGIRRAHKIHHKKLTKEGGECFGMLWVPLKYFNKK